MPSIGWQQTAEHRDNISLGVQAAVKAGRGKGGWVSKLAPEYLALYEELRKKSHGGSGGAAASDLRRVITEHIAVVERRKARNG